MSKSHDRQRSFDDTPWYVRFDQFVEDMIAIVHDHVGRLRYSKVEQLAQQRQVNQYGKQLKDLRGKFKQIIETLCKHEVRVSKSAAVFCPRDLRRSRVPFPSGGQRVDLRSNRLS